MYTDFFQEHKKRIVNSLIRCASYSRHNGFNNQESEDTMCEHWAFEIKEGERQFQAISCIKCGEYKVSNTFTLPRRISCRCA